MKLGPFARLVLTSTALLVLAMGALSSAWAKTHIHHTGLFTAITRDLNGDGRIDAIDLHGRGLRLVAHQVHVAGYRVLRLEALRGGDRILLGERSIPDSGVRPLVSADGATVRPLDGAAPIVLAASTADLRAQGRIDDIRLTLSGPPRKPGLSSAFSVAGYAISGVHLSGDRVDLSLVPHSGYDTGERPAVSVRNLQGPHGGHAHADVITPSDGAPPILVATPTAVLSPGGHLDGIELQLSEPVRVLTGAAQVSGYRVAGTRDYPSGALTVLLSGGPQSPGNTLPAVSLNGADLRDGGGNPGPSGTVTLKLPSVPVMIAARDEGFWLTGERIVTVWSGAVHVAGPGDAGAFSMSTAQGRPIAGSGLAPGDAPNEIAVDLPLGSETPTQVTYTGAGATHVVAESNNLGTPSPWPIPVTQNLPNFTGTLVNPFNQDQMMPFGERSFYLQPWRSYIDTFPATRMLNAVGINFNVDDSHVAEIDAGARLLHDAGFTHARINITWDDMEYSDPSQINPAKLARITNELQQFKTNGIRPLILLQANDESPTPSQPVTLNLTAAAPAGATTVQLDSASTALVQPGLTGFNQYGIMAGVLITSVNGNDVATLSQPLQSALAAGPQTAVDLAFQPFFPEYNMDGSLNATNQATLNGWVQYVASATKAVKSILGDDDFDVEVWNELGFGSDFLSASNYYSPAPQGSGDIDQEILQSTVNYIRNPAKGLPDVGIGDGFTNQEPFTGGATEVPGVTAMDKHPYQGAVDFPSQATYDGIVPLDALGQVDGTNVNGSWHDTFTPAFTAFFPEFPLTGIHTETITRDLAPFLSDIYGGLHGRGTHPPGGPAPQMWVTEVNLDPTSVNETLTSQDGAATSAMSAADLSHFEAKAILRYLASYVGKGVTQIDFYAAANAGDFNLIDPNFWSTSQTTNSYPGLTAGGETMVAVNRFLATMAGAQNLTQTNPLSLASISDYDGAYQFAGNGTAAYPPLYNRNMIGFFPFQVNAHKWVIPTYVMTLDLATLYNTSAPDTDVTRQDMPQEVFSLTIAGVNPATASASATDPITGQSVPVKITGRGTSTISLEIPLADYPRMLTLTDS